MRVYQICYVHPFILKERVFYILELFSPFIFTKGISGLI